MKIEVQCCRQSQNNVFVFVSVERARRQNWYVAVYAMLGMYACFC